MRDLSPSGLLAILVTIVFTVAGQLLVKKGMVEVGPSPHELGVLTGFLLRALLHVKVVAGLACAVAAALAWMAALSRAPLNLAYPFMGLPMVIVLALSGLLLNETTPWNRWAGVAIVCVGLVVASFR